MSKRGVSDSPGRAAMHSSVSMGGDAHVLHLPPVQSKWLPSPQGPVAPVVTICFVLELEERLQGLLAACCRRPHVRNARTIRYVLRNWTMGPVKSGMREWSIKAMHTTAANNIYMQMCATGKAHPYGLLAAQFAHLRAQLGSLAFAL